MDKINFNNKSNQIQPNKKEINELDKKIKNISNKQKENIEILQSNKSVEIKQKAVEQLSNSSEEIKEILSIQESIQNENELIVSKFTAPLEQNIPPEKEGVKEFKTFKAFDSYIEQRVKDLKAVKGGDVEKIEIVGSIAASIIQAGRTLSIEKLEKNIEKIKEKIKSIEEILSGVKEAAPFLESLKILIPIIQIGRLKKGIEECNSLIHTIEERLKKEPENKNLQQELIKTKLQLNKLQEDWPAAI